MNSIKRFFEESLRDKKMTTGKALTVLGCMAAAVGAIQLGEVFSVVFKALVG